MIHKFLKAKHWQLFLLTAGLPVIMQIIIFGKVFYYLIAGTEPDPFFMQDVLSLAPFLMIVIMAVFFGWFWSVAMGLQHKMPEGLKMKLNKFKVFFFTPLIYILCLIFLLVAGGVGLISGGVLVAIILPLHLFSMFCMFYTLYFVAKTLKTAELQREVSFSDFAGEFFLIWFYPIGIWIVQPRINRMLSE